MNKLTDKNKFLKGEGLMIWLACTFQSWGALTAKAQFPLDHTCQRLVFKIQEICAGAWRRNATGEALLLSVL